MKKISSNFIGLGLIFVLGLAACGPQVPAITAAEATALAGGALAFPGSVATVTPGELALPVTGGLAAESMGQFCVDRTAQLVLSVPANASFQVMPADPESDASSASCSVIEQINGRQLLLCYGVPGTSFTMDLCVDGACSQVVLPLTCQGPQAQPVTGQGSGRGVATPLAPNAVPTPRPPSPTQEPKPTPKPDPTQKPKPTPKPKPTHKPKATHKAPAL
jgi:cell division septation protein DedD